MSCSAVVPTLFAYARRRLPTDVDPYKWTLFELIEVIFRLSWIQFAGAFTRWFGVFCKQEHERAFRTCIERHMARLGIGIGVAWSEMARYGTKLTGSRQSARVSTPQSPPQFSLRCTCRSLCAAWSCRYWAHEFIYFVFYFLAILFQHLRWRARRCCPAVIVCPFFDLPSQKINCENINIP